MNPHVELAARHVLAGQSLDAEQAMQLTRLAGDDLYDLFYWANRVRIERFGRTISLCSIAAGKVGACSEDCAFCAQAARHRTTVQPSQMSDEQIVSAAADAAGRGASRFGIVNSGRGPTDAEIGWMSHPLRRIASEGKVSLCASLGHLTPDQARHLRELGVRRYHHNLETSRRFYPNVVTTHTFDERISTLRVARNAGMELCSGGIFNLGEDWSDRVDMAITLRELGVESVPLNFLSPIPGTPLAHQPPMSAMDVLKTIAIYRMILPDREIKMAGGRDANLRDLQSWIFFCGASSTMIGNYLTTCGRPADQDLRMLTDLGLDFTCTEHG